jgi:hypothetical protein
MTARLYLLLEEQQLEHDTEIETAPRASRKSYKTFQDTTTQGKKFSTQARTLTDSTRPIVRDASLNSSTSRRSAMTSASYGVSTYRHRCASSCTCAPRPRPPEGSTSAAGRPCRGRLPPSVAGAVLVPTLSASDAAVAPVRAAALVTSAIETAGDSPTGVSFSFLPNVHATLRRSRGRSAHK